MPITHTPLPCPSLATCGRIAAVAVFHLIACDPVVESEEGPTPDLIADPQPSPVSAALETDQCSGVEITSLNLTRTNGPPNHASGIFVSTGQLCVEITAGKGDKKTAPSSASVSLTGAGMILGPNEFKNKSWTRSFLVEAGDYGQRELTIELASTPGSFVGVRVFEQGVDPGEVPVGGVPAVIYPEQGGELKLEHAGLQWGPGTVDQPQVVWCAESDDGPELAIECGPPTVFQRPLTVALPVSPAMMVDTLAGLYTAGKAPTIVWDDEPRATITEVTTNTAYAAIEHFSGGTVKLLEYVTEWNQGQITSWSQDYASNYPHQTLEYPIFVGSANVGEKAYRKYIVPKRPGLSLDFNLQTLAGDADLFTNYTSLDDTSRSSHQYQSTRLDRARDAVSVPVTKAGLYFAAVQGWEPGSNYRLLIKPVGNDNQSSGLKWAAILDAGHGFGGCEGPPDPAAMYERMINKDIVDAAMATLKTGVLQPLPANQVDFITYEEILKWAEVKYGISEAVHRFNETLAIFGCTGYRGLMMRLWARETGHLNTVALQVHNDTHNWNEPFEDFGSQASNLGLFGADPAWAARLQAAMVEGMDQPWLEVLDASAEKQGFVRGAAGYALCGGQVASLEALCDDSNVSGRPDTYGAGLHSAALLEVAHYTAKAPGDVLFVDARPEDGWMLNDVEFLQQSGQMIAFEVQRYLLAKIHPDY